MNIVSINKNLISVVEAAEIIGCTTRNVRKLIDEGKVKATALHNRSWVVYRSSAEAYARKPQEIGQPRKGFKTDQKFSA